MFQVASDLASKAITLMIRAGSQESSFLSAYYTISVVPTLLVIALVLYRHMDRRVGIAELTSK